MQLEGQAGPPNVVAWFPDVETDEKCCNSEVYQRELNRAGDAAEGELMIIKTDE